MKNLILLLLLWNLLPTKGQTQNAVDNIPGLTTNLDLTWTEVERFSYFVNDETDISDLSDLDYVQLKPKTYRSNYHYNWNERGFNFYETTILNHLQEGEYFSFEPTIRKYTQSGIVEISSLDGNFLKEENFDIKDKDTWHLLPIEAVSPKYQVPSGFTFVPVLSRNELDRLASDGFSIDNFSPDYFETHNSNVRFIIDSRTMTSTQIFTGNQQMPPTTITTYYVLDGNYLIKIKKVEQSAQTLPSGICISRIIEVNYQNVVLNDGGMIIPRESGSNIISANVYPNPTLGNFIISSLEPDAKIANIEIFDIAGQKVNYISTSNLNNSVRITPIKAMAGILLVKYTVNGKPQFQKILILNK